MADLKITKGTLNVYQRSHNNEDKISTILIKIGYAILVVGPLSSCAISTQEDVFSWGIFIPTTIGFFTGGILYVALGKILRYLAHLANTHYYCTIEELEGTIDNMDVTIKNSVKIDGMVEADLKKISIPKPTSPKPTPKSATDPESKA